MSRDADVRTSMPSTPSFPVTWASPALLRVRRQVTIALPPVKKLKPQFRSQKKGTVSDGVRTSFFRTFWFLSSSVATQPLPFVLKRSPFGYVYLSHAFCLGIPLLLAFDSTYEKRFSIYLVFKPVSFNPSSCALSRCQMFSTVMSNDFCLIPR